MTWTIAEPPASSSPAATFALIWYLRTESGPTVTSRPVPASSPSTDQITPASRSCAIAMGIEKPASRCLHDVGRWATFREGKCLRGEYVRCPGVEVGQDRADPARVASGLQHVVDLAVVEPRRVLYEVSVGEAAADSVASDGSDFDVA